MRSDLLTWKTHCVMSERGMQLQRSALRTEQERRIESLTQQLNDALTRVDNLSADLAKERSLREFVPRYYCTAVPSPPYRTATSDIYSPYIFSGA